jgi:hypothetical protein
MNLCGYVKKTKITCHLTPIVFKIIEGDRAKLEVKLIEAILLGNLEEAERISAKLRPLPKTLLRPIQNLIKENNLL